MIPFLAFQSGTSLDNFAWVKELEYSAPITNNVRNTTTQPVYVYDPITYIYMYIFYSHVKSVKHVLCELQVSLREEPTKNSHLTQHFLAFPLIDLVFPFTFLTLIATFYQQLSALFSRKKKLSSTHCKLPPQHQTAEKQSQPLAGG